MADLAHELDRCSRGNGRLVVAYVDVVGLKALNDTKGHSAGDELITRVARLIKRHLRSYDLMIRIGGDEFLLAMSNMDLADARQRFGEIAGALADGPGAGAICTGFSALLPDETADELIARADSELLASRRANGDSRPALTARSRLQEPGARTTAPSDGAAWNGRAEDQPRTC